MVAIISFLLAQATSKEVTFKGAGDFELQGTLLMPASSKPVPGILLLPGSGPMDRDENAVAMGVKTDNLKQIAERLAQEGVATLRFDKRAIAKAYASKWPKDPTKDDFFGWDKFVGDAKAGYRFLREQPGIDKAKTALLGHSEGSLISLQVGSDLEATPDRPTSLILVAGNGRPLDVVLLEQLRSKIPQQAPPDVAKSLLEYIDKAVPQLKKDGTLPPDTPPALQALFNPSSLSILRSYFNTDPVALAKGYSGDVLVLNGELDNQVSAERDAKPLFAALQSRAKGEEELVIVPGVGHGLKATKKIEENVLEGPMLPAVLDAIAGWVRKHLAQ